MDTPQMLEAFDRDGFVLIESLMDDRQLAAAQNGVEWAMAHSSGPYKWIKQRSYEWYGDHPIFVELIEHPLVLEFAREWLGPEFHLIAAQCSRNSRDDHYAPGVVNIHADTVFFPEAGRQANGVAAHRYGFSAMWHLQDTPLEMGPTELLPGSHLSSDLFTNETIDNGQIFRRHIPAGSLLLFNHRTWHRGAMNETDKPRDLITNAYARREIDKVQLTTTMDDGTQRYVEPAALWPVCSPAVRQMLSNTATG
jgi:hypothetical protein